jgi:nuclease-like protein
MTWPRKKKSRSSALPVTREHSGVHIIVTPASDSEHARGHGQNTGISGTRHTVASTGPANAETVSTTAEDMTLTGNAPVAGAEADAVPPGNETVSLEPVEYEPADDRDDEERRSAGIEILGVATAEVPAEQPDQDPPEAAVSEAPRLNQPVTGASPQPTSEDAGSNHRPFGGFGQAGDGAAGSADDQPQRTRVRDLALDARVRLWRLRALIMLVVGVVFSIIAGWPTGITLAILAGIADTIYRSRTVGSVPSPGKLDRAQRNTQRQLSRMHRAGYLAWHARPIPGSMEVIDHLVVGPTGVYAIDSEKWDKKMPIRTRNGKQLWHGPDSKKARLEHARWEAGQASERLSAALGKNIAVRPAMAVYGPSIPWDIATIREVDVFSGGRLRKYLRRRAKTKGLPRLSRDEVREIYEAAGKVMPLAPTKTATPVG